MVEKRNFVAEAGRTSGCDNHRLGGVRFLDDSLRPTLNHPLLLLEWSCGYPLIRFDSEGYQRVLLHSRV